VNCPSFHRINPSRAASHTLPSGGPQHGYDELGEQPLFRREGRDRRLSEPIQSASRGHPDGPFAISKRLQLMLPARPSDVAKVSARPARDTDEASLAVAIQSPPSRSRSSLFESTSGVPEGDIGLLALRIGYGSILSSISCLSALSRMP
jgi:hypothetical protein